MTDIIPTNTNLLFWPPEQQSAGYRNMEKVFNTQLCPAGGPVRALPMGAPLDVDWSTDVAGGDVDAFMAANHVAGLLVLHRGQVRLERYDRGLTPEQRWTSFSVAKSFTSTLVGAAIEDGVIAGLEAPLTDHLPELVGSAYDGVTVRQLLTMTSGVRWNEDYADPNSDVARCGRDMSITDRHPTVDYMSKLPRDAEPGVRHLYSTGETDLTGIMVTRATGKTLAGYLSEKVWKPFGMEADAVWVCDKAGRERGGSGISARLRDFARFGLFILADGVAGGRRVLPEGWVQAATTTQIPQVLEGGTGYGFQWWTFPDGSYRGAGIFGQGLFIDPKADLVVAHLGAWPKAVDPELAANRFAFYRAVRAAVRR
jgi:CubicO group peptidase (beta-lactamase class C family)